MKVSPAPFEKPTEYRNAKWMIDGGASIGAIADGILRIYA